MRERGVAELLIARYVTNRLEVDGLARASGLFERLISIKTRNASMCKGTSWLSDAVCGTAQRVALFAIASKLKITASWVGARSNGVCNGQTNQTGNDTEGKGA